MASHAPGGQRLHSRADDWAAPAAARRSPVSSPGTLVAAFLLSALTAGVAGAETSPPPGADGGFGFGFQSGATAATPPRLASPARPFQGTTLGALPDEPQSFSLRAGDLASEAPDRFVVQWDLPLSGPVPPPPRGDALRGVRNWDAPYSTKFLRGTIIITGTELLSGVVLALLPKDSTKWEEGQFNHGLSNLKRAWTSPPVWDGDIYFHNWIGHPYAGAFYYNMIRSQGGTAWQSAKFALFQTLLWEYVIEAVAEQPSIQDLITTPILGSLLGELFHQLSMGILRKGHLNFGQKVLVFFLNPSYVINNGYRPPE